MLEVEQSRGNIEAVGQGEQGVAQARVENPALPQAGVRVEQLVLRLPQVGADTEQEGASLSWLHCPPLEASTWPDSTSSESISDPAITTCVPLIHAAGSKAVSVGEPAKASR